ncbi:MAG: chemoreceptor glutamine deamidase CheD [Burkholderiaceae bacterium]|jgi:chemotaxis protein CheD|nr:chemoreceptor glutamine deamidase CheD [Burkholderiaceae bacterium]
MSDIQSQFATNTYYDRSFNLNAAKILPGQYYFTKENMVIVTVLGSCVSACIRDKVSRVGGMNHFMLPDEGSGGSDGLWSASMRYGAYAMEVLVNELLKAGARRENLEAKVFGGGHVLSGFSTLDVGSRNAQFVRDYLKAERIRVLAEDLEDFFPRKVYFFPTTGKVLVKKIKRINNNTIANREQDYASRLAKDTGGGSVDLF